MIDSFGRTPGFTERIGERWRTLKVQHKVDAALVVLLIPLSCALALHLYLVSLLLTVQQVRHSQLAAREQVQVLRRLAVDIEDAFRGYVLTTNKDFLIPLYDAESKLGSVEQDITRLHEREVPLGDLQAVLPRLKHLLHSKHKLITDIQAGRQAHALSYIRSGQGLILSDALRQDLKKIEDRLDGDIRRSNARAVLLSTWTFTGLWIALGGVFVLWWITSRIFVQSLTGPIARLQLAATSFGVNADMDGMQKLLSPLKRSGDELAMLAESYHQMAMRISRQLRELETLEAIGREINTIGPDGFLGVLRRLTDRAVELMQAKVCLVLLRNDTMGCWIIEAASGRIERPVERLGDVVGGVARQCRGV